MNIGEKVRDRRKDLELSLRELGKRAGVTASFLSQLENDQVSPSLNTLQSIATALRVPMFSLLNDIPGGNVVKVDQRRRFHFDNDQISYDLLTPDFTRDMMAYLIHIGPGARRIAQPLAKPTQQWMHVISGQLKIIIGENEHILDKGDTVYYDGELLKEFGSANNLELIILCCISPPVF